MAAQSKKTRVLHLRVSEADFAQIDVKLKATGLTVSEFLREVFLNSKITFHVKEAKPKDYQRLLFICNKAGNNINQLAHNVNSAHRRGVLSETVYKKFLNSLVNIEALLLHGLGDAH